MPRPRSEVPTYRHHKPSGQAVCTVNLSNGQRKDLYLGVWESVQSKAAYTRVVATVAANRGIYPTRDSDVSINEALVRYIHHVDSYYRDPDGKPSRSVKNIKAAVSYLTRLFGMTNLADFTPSALETIRYLMIQEGKARKTINKTAVLIRQFFRWAVAKQLVSPAVLESLKALPALAPGRSGAKEGKPREPADPKAVEWTLPYLPPAVRAIVQLLRLTGARPSEILTLRPCDIDRTRDVWSYRVESHKTAWRGRSRTIHFGPAAQAVLLPWLTDVAPDGYVLSPVRSEGMRNIQRSEKRETPRWPSHLARNQKKRIAHRRRPPSNRYTVNTLALAVRRACDAAGVAPWTCYQLRHLKAVELRQKYGLEHVRAVLGQTFMSMSDHYSRKADDALASKAAAEDG